MNTPVKFFRIGKLAASHGLKGELILAHSLGKRSALKDLEAIFIKESDDNFLPHFLESATVRNDEETLIKLEGIDNKEAARRLTPRDVWLQEDDFKRLAAQTAPIAMLGYSLFNGTEDLGEIIEVLEQPHQVLCTIMYKGKEALVPVHADNTIRLDAKSKRIFVDIPDGLLELYDE